MRSIPVLLAMLIYSCTAKQENMAVKPHDVLIIYSSGSAYKNISEVEPEKIDAFTCPTPTDFNCKKIAIEMMKKLKKKNIDVAVIDAINIRDYRTILSSKAIVLGSPSRFWNVSWEMKKMFDEVFEKIYVAHRDEFKKIKVYSYSMAEYDGSAALTLKMIRHAVGDCGNKVDSSMIFIAKKPVAVYMGQCEDLAGAIYEGLTKSK